MLQFINICMLHSDSKEQELSDSPMSSGDLSVAFPVACPAVPANNVSMWSWMDQMRTCRG